MHSQLRLFTILSTVVAISQLMPLVKADEIVINNRNFDHNPEITLEVVGIRPVANPSLSSVERFQRVRLSEDLLIRAALQFDDVAEQLRILSESDANLTYIDIKNALISSGWAERHLFTSGDNQRRTDIDSVSVISSIAEEAGFEHWDAIGLMNMVATGLIDFDSQSYIETERGPYRAFQIEKKFQPVVGDVVQKMTAIENQDLYYAASTFDDAKNQIRQYDETEKALLVYYGDITFGRPVVYKAEEMRLLVPESLTRDFDIYWLELSATFYDISNDNDIIELAVNFGLPSNCVAFEAYTSTLYFD